MRALFQRVTGYLAKNHRTVAFSTKVAGLFVEAAKTPGFASAAQVLFGTLNAYAEVSAVTAHSYLGMNGWVRCIPDNMDTLVEVSFRHLPAYEVNVRDDNYFLMCFVLGGHDVIVLRDRDMSHSLFIYARKEEKEAVRKHLLRGVRAYYPRACVLNMELGKYGEHSYSVTEDVISTHHTEKTIAFARRIRSYNEAGVSRSVLFYGPPGTGKTTFAQSVPEFLGYRSLRLRIGGVSTLPIKDLLALLGFFQPEAVLIDDFDRLGTEVSTLELLEVINKKVKVLLVTVNTLTTLSHALKRPQRFDEIVSVTALEPDVVLSILGEKNKEYFPRVKDWPVSYIEEFSKRMRVEGSEQLAETWLIELETRCHEEQDKPPATTASPATPPQETK